MDTSRLIAAVMLALGSGLVHATGPAHQVGGHEPAGSRETDVSASGDRMGMMSMPENMQKLRQQMMEIKRTQDPDKREALIERHRQSMQEMMRSMQTMQKPSTEAGQDGSMQRMNQRQDMLEQRMQMMQMMMDQMMQNQAAAEDTSRLRRNHDHRKQMK